MTFRLVFFDVDSTLVTIEGIDVLAGDNADVARLTEAAMNGDLPIDQVYAKRLEMIRPSRAQIDALADRYLHSITTGAKETIDALRGSGVNVQILSAGIAQAIAPLAAHLGVRNVHAVPLRFDASGNFEDFDRRSFLTKAGGKETVVRDVRARSHGRAALVGDGVADLEAKPAVDLFIGFGGVQSRPRVKENAAVFIEDRDLRATLKYLV
jgi:phosphoserine phosphatase